MEELFARYLPRVRQMVALRMGRKLSAMEDSEDLVQEALMAAFKGLDRFEHRSVGSFRHWLTRLAENRIRDQARHATAEKRGGKHVLVGDPYESGVLAQTVLRTAGETPSQAAQAHELEQQLEAALLQLGERDRRTIVMRRVAGMEFEEIATELDLAGASVARSLFARALQKLSERL